MNQKTEEEGLILGHAFDDHICLYHYTVPKIIFYSESLQGIEFIQYFTNWFKLRVGIGLALEQQFQQYQDEDDTWVNTFIGPGAKIDTTFQINKYFGIKTGLDSSFYFWGFYQYLNDIDNSGILKDFKK